MDVYKSKGLNHKAEPLHVNIFEYPVVVGRGGGGVGLDHCSLACALWSSSTTLSLGRQSPALRELWSF